MGKIVKGVTDAVGLTDSREGARAVREGTAQQVAAEREALNYLKQREALPQQFREGALTQLGGLYGLEGGDADAYQNIQNNPIYQAALGDIGMQEEAILRNQSATGALRSSGTEQMLARNQQQRQFGALQAALGGLQGLASLPSNANQIAAQTAGIGQTQRQGTIGYTQSKLAGEQAAFDETMGLVKTGAEIFGFSDVRLKSDIKPAGTRYGQDWFTWNWNDKAQLLGLFGESEGVIADLVKESRPDLVGISKGYLTVNYEALANER